MTAFENAIADFCRRLGMRSLAAGMTEKIELFLGGFGRLRLEIADGLAVVTLARPAPAGGGAEIADMLRGACGLPRSHPWEVRPESATDAGLMALTAHVPLPEFTGGAIEELAGSLAELLDVVERGGRP